MVYPKIKKNKIKIFIRIVPSRKQCTIIRLS